MTDDIQTLLDQLTLEEKAALCTGKTNWLTVPVERLGIPSIWVADGPHGVRKVPPGQRSSLPATCFPTASAMAATWNRDLIYELGQALGDECIAQEVDILLGPGNNIKRTPLCGRNFEYYSEDPLLSGEIAASFIKGVQSKGVGTSLKHFVANNQEYKRMAISAQIDERALREIYLAGFEIAVRQAQPWSVMCSYNKVNGTFASEHYDLLTDILKDEWGFAGFVVSDWGAVRDRVAALRGGLDLEMPGPRPDRTQSVIDAVNTGELDIAMLDAAIKRILRIVFQAHATPKGHTAFDVDQHHALARRVASEAIVLLKNEGDLLPLNEVASLAVIGVTAQNARYQGDGSSIVNPTRLDSPLAALQAAAGEIAITYAPGYTMENEFRQDLIDEAVSAAAQAQVALLYVGLPTWKETEGIDRPDMALTDQQIALIKAVAATAAKTVVILNTGAALEMAAWIDDVDAVLQAWFMTGGRWRSRGRAIWQREPIRAFGRNISDPVGRYARLHQFSR